MRKKSLNNDRVQERPGIVLLVTLVLLVIMATLGYTLSSRVATKRHRDLYIIDYSQARYACDSAVKYALSSLQDINPQLISRPNEPDFSDLFVLSEAERRELLAQWADEHTTETKSGFNSVNSSSISPSAFLGTGDINSDEFGFIDSNEPMLTSIRGPYGPSWPFVTEPVEFEIGSAKVTIEIEDENAKYPIGWMLLDDETVQREVMAGFQIFCEWMGLKTEQVNSIKGQLQQISKIKPFQIEFKPIKQTIRRTPTARRPTIRRKSSTKRVTRTYRPQIKTETISPSVQLDRQNVDFAKLFHSSLIDTEALAQPCMEDTKESALKYMGMWASSKVNINTAPRHVLEAAFAFGGPSDAPSIAEEIIQRRRIKPFADIENLKTELSRYSNSIGKCEKYITTASNFFTIKITAISGVAKASATISAMKDGKRLKRIAVISG